jgi:hypothetical protein
MFNRVVSVSSLLLAIVSVVLFVLGSWWILTGKMTEGEGLFQIGGWMLSALFFAYRFADPDYLDPVSIVKAR